MVSSFWVIGGVSRWRRRKRTGGPAWWRANRTWMVHLWATSSIANAAGHAAGAAVDSSGDGVVMGRYPFGAYLPTDTGSLGLGASPV
ncbi:MAG: hypothetical protein BGO49_08370 [Planctomycetales bacterium 71-10]|nr:MAG: hypothetical protein BGO49_08370 [Planctomycetales bacterium 71-10]